MKHAAPPELGLDVEVTLRSHRYGEDTANPAKTETGTSGAHKPSERPPTSLRALTLHTPQVANPMPTTQTAVLEIQLVGRDHQPPIGGRADYSTVVWAK